MCIMCVIIPKPTARSAVPGVSPGGGLLIPLVYLHPGKCEDSEVQSPPQLCNGRSTLGGFRRYAHARVQAESGLESIKLVLRKRFCIANIMSEINCHFTKVFCEKRWQNLVKRKADWIPCIG